MGYSRESQGFIVGSPDGQTCRRVFVSRNVQFDDKTFPVAGHSSKWADEQDDSGGELLEIPAWETTFPKMTSTLWLRMRLNPRRLLRRHSG